MLFRKTRIRMAKRGVTKAETAREEKANLQKFAGRGAFGRQRLDIGARRARAENRLVAKRKKLERLEKA